jgi:diguanylate cyclase (GGDEF)-like protein
MVETEAETMTVLHRAFAQRVPDRSATLLLADSSDSHLTEAMQVANGPIEGRRCSVQEPRRCPAIRHSRAQHFRDSEAVDACPHLHSEHDAAAATDPLTGLMNRRVVEERAAGPLHRQLPVAVAMADLDHFKVLNDTYGHEAGDRALRLFASTLAASLRQHDLASRYGGEEFLLVFPDLSARAVADVLRRCQEELMVRLGAANVPGFTASYGVADTSQSTDLATLVSLATARCSPPSARDATGSSSRPRWSNTPNGGAHQRRAADRGRVPLRARPAPLRFPGRLAHCGHGARCDVTWVAWLVAGMLALGVVDRLALLAEARGWIRWRRTPPSRSSTGNALLHVQTIFEPQIQHVVDEREQIGAEQPGDDEPPDPI